MSAAELAAARAERAARFQASQQAAPASVPAAAPSQPSAAAASPGSSRKQERASAEDGPNPLDGIVLSGVDDCPEEVRAALRSKRIHEVDCRLWESGFKPVAAGSRVFTLNRGEGSLHDKKAESDVDRERNIRHLTESALRIHTALTRGERVWVHCHLGKNRGPAGLMAFLILHTPVPSLREVMASVKAHDVRQPRVAATERNTFAAELAIMCTRAGKSLE